MSKAIKKAGGLIGGVVGGVIGFVVGGPVGAAIGFSIGAGIDRAAQALAAKPKIPKTSTATSTRLTATINPDEHRKIAFGETAFGTDLRYWENYGSENSSYDQAFAATTHEVESFGKLYLDEEEVTFSGNDATGNYAGALTRLTRTVGVTGTALSAGAGAKWTSSSSMTGCAHYVLKWQWSQEKLPRGIPSRITQVGKGALVYDPRLDDTAGGEGDHRADDQSTWEYSPTDSNGVPIGRNPALQILWYLIGWRITNPDTSEEVLVAGMGVPLDDIDFASFITAANDCEDNEYYSDCLLSTGDAHQTNLAVLEATCAGKVMDSGGRYSLRILTDTTGDVVQSFDDGDIVGGITWKPRLPMGQQWNQGAGTFIDPAALYQKRPIPIVRDASYEAADGYKKRNSGFNYDAVQDGEQGQKLIRLELNRSRYQGVFAAAFNWKAKKVQVRDIVTLTLPRFGFSNRIFRVIEKKIDPLGAIWLLLREDDDSIYSGGTVDPIPAPGVGAGYDPRAVTAPDAEDWTVIPAYVEGNGAKIPVLLLSGSVPAANITYVHVWHGTSPTGPWRYDGAFRAGEAISIQLTGLVPNQVYYVRLVYENAYGVKSEPTVLGPYTSGSEYQVPNAGEADSAAPGSALDDILTAAQAAIDALQDDVLGPLGGSLLNVIDDPLFSAGVSEAWQSGPFAVTLVQADPRALQGAWSFAEAGDGDPWVWPVSVGVQEGATVQVSADVTVSGVVTAARLEFVFYDEDGAALSTAVAGSGVAGRLGGFAVAPANAVRAAPQLVAVGGEAGIGNVTLARPHASGALAGQSDLTPFQVPGAERPAAASRFLRAADGIARTATSLQAETRQTRASVRQAEIAIADANSALAAAITSLQAEIDADDAAVLATVDLTYLAQADLESAVTAISLEGNADFDGHTAQFVTQGSAISTLETATAAHLTQVSAGAAYAALELYAENSGGGATSFIQLIAQKVQFGGAANQAFVIIDSTTRELSMWNDDFTIKTLSMRGDTPDLRLFDGDTGDLLWHSADSGAPTAGIKDQATSVSGIAAFDYGGSQISGSSWQDLTGASVALTPADDGTQSAVIVFGVYGIRDGGDNDDVDFRIVRDGSTVVGGPYPITFINDLEPWVLPAFRDGAFSGGSSHTWKVQYSVTDGTPHIYEGSLCVQVLKR